MADPKGFLTTPKQLAERRPVDVRIKDWNEVYVERSLDRKSTRLNSSHRR